MRPANTSPTAAARIRPGREPGRRSGGQVSRPATMLPFVSLRSGEAWASGSPDPSGARLAAPVDIVRTTLAALDRRNPQPSCSRGVVDPKALADPDVPLGEV